MSRLDNFGGLVVSLQFLLVLLSLSGIIDWPMWVVLLPALLISAMLFVLYLVVCVGDLCVMIGEAIDRR